MKKIVGHKLNRGFTLVELLIAMVLFSIFILVLTDIFSSVLNVKKESESTSYIDQDAQYIISRLFYDIPLASAVAVPSSLGATSSTLQVTISGATYTYSSSSGNLVLTTASGANALNSFNTALNSLSFLRLGKGSGKDTVQVQFTLISKLRQASGYESKSYQTTIGIR